MDVHSTIELLQPCMHIWLQAYPFGGLRVGTEPHLLLVVPLQAHSEPATKCTGEIGDCNTRMVAFRNVLSAKMLEICTITLKYTSTFLSPHYKWLNKLTAFKSLLNKRQKSSSFCIPLAVALVWNRDSQLCLTTLIPTNCMHIPTTMCLDLML